MYGITVKVKYYDSDENKEKNSYFVGGVENLTDAAKKVEDYFGDELMEASFEFITDEGCGLIEVPHYALEEIKQLNDF